MGTVLFPLLLIVALFGIIILVGIVASYFWLLWLGAEATRCPECRKRGAGRIVENKLLDQRNYVDTTQRKTVRVIEKTFEDHYECEQCGHTWTKTATEKKRTPV